MSVQLGTVAAIGFEDLPPRQCLACYREIGCKTVQAYRNAKVKLSVGRMLDAIAEGQMPCDSLHGVFGEQYDPSAPDEQVRRFAVDTYKSEGELAIELGGPLVIVHCSTVRREGVSSQERARRVEQLGRSIAELGAFGRQIGVRYAFENLPSHHAIGSDVGELAGLLARVGAPNTGMCLDAGHANMVGDTAQAALAGAGRMIYIHLSDNFRAVDDHLMPGQGTIDTDALGVALAKANYAGTVMLEVFYPPERLRRAIDEGCGKRMARMIELANG